MKKFFINNIVISISMLVVLYFLSQIWINYLDESSVKFLELKNNKNISKLKIINIGSSHTNYGIKYPENIKGYNLALSGQSFYYDYEILKEYHKKFDKDCIIIIPISIFSFYSGENIENIDLNYVSFLDKKFFKMDKVKCFLQKYFTVLYPSKRIKEVCRYIFNSFKNRKLEKIFVRYPKNLSLKEKEKAVKTTALRHLGIGVINKEFAKDKKIGIKQLVNILIFCEEKGFRPVLISTPQTYLYNDEIGEKNYQVKIYDNIKEVENQLNKKYLYLDYSHDERFINNLEYFSDDDHLNEKGAEYFTKILLNDIKTNLLVI